MSDQERLHKVLARNGIASRRKAEELIANGRVSVNGEVVTQMGVKVTDEDEIRLDGELVRASELMYYLLNKPTGVVTTLSDPQRRPTIKKFIPTVSASLKPVGRLDMDTEGLLILTNDGDFASRMTHPRYKVEKVYQVTVKGSCPDDVLNRLEKGIMIEGRKTAPARAQLVHRSPEATTFLLTIHEGRNRQIRKMCDAVGFPVSALKRTQIGPLILKGLRAGECRLLGKAEVDKLKKLVGLES
ncbi:MAG: rRNA pseudouridine synthase [Armatimonadetes bacterium]|nr:rRNA pseudouridine synthase [Armatimonadota bacterium]